MGSEYENMINSIENRKSIKANRLLAEEIQRHSEELQTQSEKLQRQNDLAMIDQYTRIYYAMTERGDKDAPQYLERAKELLNRIYDMDQPKEKRR